MSPARRGTGCPSPRSSQRNRGWLGAITLASRMRIWSRQSSHGDALPLASEEFVGGAKLEREMEREVPGGPGPVAVRARASGQESAAGRLGVAALEPGDATADVPDVVRVAATGDRQHQLQVAQRRPRVVRGRKDPRVVDA